MSKIIYRKPIIFAIERAGERERRTPTQAVIEWNHREVQTEKGEFGKFKLYHEKANPDAVRLLGVLASGFNIDDDIEHQFLLGDMIRVMAAVKQDRQAPDFWLGYELARIKALLKKHHFKRNSRDPLFKQELMLLLAGSLDQSVREDLVNRFIKRLDLDSCIGGGSLHLDKDAKTLWAHGYAFGLGFTPTRVVEGALHRFFQMPPFNGYEFLTAAKEIEDCRENPAREWYQSHGCIREGGLG